MSKLHREYDLIERPFRAQLKAIGRRWLGSGGFFILTRHDSSPKRI